MCLDIFRGLCVAGMIVVDNPGSDAKAYGPIMHAEWNGWTPAASLIYSLVSLSFCWILLWFLWRKRVFLKV